MAEQLIRLYEDGVKKGVCRHCRAELEFYPTLRGRSMPMNAGAVPRRSETDKETGRVIVFMSADDSHFATCPNADEFRRRA